MKRITREMIVDWSDHFDHPGFAVPPDGLSVREVLAMPNIDIEDRLGIVARADVMGQRTLRLFAAWCAETACQKVGVLDAARYAIDVVMSSATDGYQSLPMMVMRRYAYNAARDCMDEADSGDPIMRDVFRSRFVAWTAVEHACHSNVEAAARRASKSAAWVAGTEAAYEAEREAQVSWLIDMHESACAATVQPSILGACKP